MRAPVEKVDVLSWNKSIKVMGCGLKHNLKENNNPLPSSKEMPVIILWVKDK